MDESSYMRGGAQKAAEIQVRLRADTWRRRKYPADAIQSHCPYASIPLFSLVKPLPRHHSQRQPRKKEKPPSFPLKNPPSLLFLLSQIHRTRTQNTKPLICSVPSSEEMTIRSRFSIAAFLTLFAIGFFPGVLALIPNSNPPVSKAISVSNHSDLNKP